MRLVAALLLVAAGCDASSKAPASRAAGEAEAGYLSARPDRAAVRAGYLERLRLGLGGPFRLVEFALSDPRLEPEVRRDLGRELLRRTAGGELYEIDPLVLLPAGLPPAERVARARAHLNLIEATVTQASDPRAGELTVRLAYRIAALETSVQRSIFPVAASVASLIRDRELAIADARRLLSAARNAGSDPVDLVAEWRRSRRLQVELPVVTPIEERLQRQAIRSIPGVLGSIRGVTFGEMPWRPRRTSSIADSEALRRLQSIADSMNMPPRAALVVALRGIGNGLPTSAGPAQRLAWAEFASAAADEERFASRQRALGTREPALRTALAAAALYAAVGLRVHAQERVWYPGTPSPTPQQLQARHGVVLLPRPDLPERWLPFFATALEESLADLRSVLPGIGFFGLTVAIPLEPKRTAALASYQTSPRVLTWPATTGLGTLAHELAHDLDFQAAQRRSSRARGFASKSPSPSLAAALAVLTPDRPETATLPAADADHARRPVEVLARTFDWFVVTRLAAMGRWNGALSSAQDEIFTGHGSLGPPGVSPEYAPAVIEAVGSLATIPAAERAAFLAEYGRLQWPGPNALLSTTAARLEAVNRAASGPAAMGVPTAGFRAVAAIGEETLREIDALRCEGRLPLVDPELFGEYRQLVIHAVTASARALALDAAEEVGGAHARQWMARELYGNPHPPAGEPADTSAAAAAAALHTASTLEAIAAQVPAVVPVTTPLDRNAFLFGSPALSCGRPGAGARLLR
ncbi:MAG: hypothetical protein KY464_07745 [Gemmatimonadetes bacterium]|nr:hypothetical protein [Gemmatimonadota bacterium]